MAAGLTALNWLYGLLRSCRNPCRRSGASPRFDWARANPLGSLRLLRAHAELLGLAGVGFLFQLAQNVLPSIFVLYTGYRYHWTPRMHGPDPDVHRRRWASSSRCSWSGRW